MRKVTYTVSAEQASRLLGDWYDEGPAYLALSGAFRALILDGRLPSGTRIPSERVFAAQSRISRNTVTAAYGLLRDEGYLEGLRGAGSITALPGSGTRRARPTSVTTGDTGKSIDLTVTQVPAPEPLLTEAVRVAAGHIGRHSGELVHDRIGLRELRQTIADRYTARGLPTSVDEIMVTTGAYQGWGLLLRLLVRNTDPVVLDSPTHPDAVQAVRSLAGRPVPVALGLEGWDPDLMASVLRQAKPVLAHLMPDHHDPTGLVMPDDTRRAVIRVARSSGTLLVADETLSDLTLDGSAPTPLASFGRRGEVVTIGSLSKVFWGGLGVGWIRAGRSLISRLAALRGPGDAGTSVVDQLTAYVLYESFDSVLHAHRRRLADRRNHLAAALRRDLPGWRFALPRGGLCLWVDLGERIGPQLVSAASQYGVKVLSGSCFAVEGSLDGYLRLPYVLPEEKLAEAVGGLAKADRLVRSNGQSGRPLVGTTSIVKGAVRA
ncbi:PLP-dependent aminotransferase family protein [Kitasatospora purpeofusca]|uniref:MocR-like transcription factor YczR n=1 Tax=Kitasatospora purpeofusca TaxID=67352 RepID=UPI0030F05EB4